MVDAHSDMARHVKLYIGVFAALAVLTVVTVTVSRMEGSTTKHVTVALLIATVKASLVSAVFMHLKWEKTLVLWLLLALCAVFFVVLMAVPVLTAGDLPPQAVREMWG